MREFINILGDLKKLIESYSRAGQMMDMQVIKKIMKEILKAIEDIHSKGAF